ncbi:MAG TPA: hypothetical protein VMZ28_28875, partial [Kofleriaceae bacterium]|nr:hypothetical protein [Kofleriaceae bacterium]
DMLRRALRRQPRDFLRVLVDPRAPGADLMSLARAGRWLDDGGARRVALETYERYVDGGGRVAEHMRRYLVLFRWWHGDRERPSGLLLADAQAAGIDTAAPQINRQDAENAKNNLGGLGGLAVHPRDVEAIRNAYRREPAVADRMAEDLADGAIVLGERAPALIDMYRELGDPARAWRWAEKLLESSPRHAPYLQLAGEVSAAAGDPARAEVFFVEAAAASGDAGASSVAAARAYLALRLPLPAVTAARRAIQLTGPGTAEHAEAIELAATGLEAVGRKDDAAELRARLRPPAVSR